MEKEEKRLMGLKWVLAIKGALILYRWAKDSITDDGKVTKDEVLKLGDELVTGLGLDLLDDALDQSVENTR